MFVDENGFVLNDEPNKKAESTKTDPVVLDKIAVIQDEQLYPAERRKAPAKERVRSAEESDVESVEEDPVEPEPVDESADEPAEDESYDLETERDEELREQVSSRAKGKDKEKKKEKQKKKPKEKKASPFVIARVFLSVVLIGVMCVTTVPRVQSAMVVAKNATKDTVIAEAEVSAAAINQEDTSETPKEKQRPTTYDYIDTAMLNQMSVTELAIWKLKEFPEGETRNEAEYEEFRYWFEDQTEFFPNFEAEYQEAVEYVLEHPELIHPVVEPEPEAEPEDTSSAANNTGTTATQNNTGTTQTSQQTNQTTNTGDSHGQQSSSSTTRSLLPSGIDSYSAAQTANWVYETFKLDASWTVDDYAKLTAYYSWLDKKPADYKRMVEGYLDLMGWSSK